MAEECLIKETKDVLVAITEESIDNIVRKIEESKMQVKEGGDIEIPIGKDTLTVREIYNGMINLFQETLELRKGFLQLLKDLPECE